jgi:hypothetical protein
MRYAFVLALVASTALVGCGDDAAMLAPELFGTWVFVNAEEDGTSWGDDCVTDCDTLTFKADGTFVLMQPLLDRRFEGYWSTQGSILTLTTTVENMEPLDPPPTSTSRWSVSGDTLSVYFAIVTFHWRKESTHEDAGLTELRGL